MMLQDEIRRLRARLREAADDEVDPEELMYLEPYFPDTGSLRYETSEDDDTMIDVLRDRRTVTHRVGSFSAPFARLIELFGQPEWTRYTRRDQDSVDSYVQWHIMFADGIYANIYDWRTGEHPEQNTDWTIGGKGFDAHIKVKAVLEGRGRRMGRHVPAPAFRRGKR